MNELSEYIKYYASDISKEPDYSILTCTLTVTYYKDVNINNVNIVIQNMKQSMKNKFHII